MAKLQTEELARLIQKQLGLVVFPATLGDENGVVYDNPAAKNGMVRIRYTTAAGLSLPPVVRMKAVLPPNPGTSVLVGYDKQHELAVLEGDYNGMMAQGVNPLVMNAADPNVYGFTNTVSITTLLCFPRTTPNVNSTDVGVKAFIYVEEDVWHYFPGELVALASFIPATGLHCVVGLYLTTADTIEMFASTPKNVLDPLTITVDVQEVHDQITAGSKPVWFWRLYGDQTAILDKDSFLDGRQFINVASSAGFTSFNAAGDSGTPQAIADGDTLLIAGGTGIDTVVSATDTVTVAIDSTVVTLTGTQQLENKSMVDNATFLVDNLDPTKRLQLQVSAVTTGQTRTWTVANADGTVLLAAAQQDVGNKTLEDSSVIFRDNINVNKRFRVECTGLTDPSTRIMTIPDYDFTPATLAGAETLTNKTLTAPTIADFTNANHDHLDADDGGTLDAAAIASGTLVHERGGLEADVSAYTGLPYISGGVTSQVALPQRASCEMLEATVTAGGYTITDVIDATHYFAYYMRQGAGAANANDGDAFSLSFWLKAGSYTMSVLGLTVADQGRIDWKVNGSTIVSAQDWYSASTTKNVIKTASVTIADNGYQKLEGVINGKNASSSDFVFRLTRIWFKPASD